jgi:hypothetical protein
MGSYYYSSTIPLNFVSIAYSACSQATVRNLEYAQLGGDLPFIRIDLFEARAILLGKLGRHDSALELYVYRLRDYHKAERYG